MRKAREAGKYVKLNILFAYVARTLRDSDGKTQGEVIDGQFTGLGKEREIEDT